MLLESWTAVLSAQVLALEKLPEVELLPEVLVLLQELEVLMLEMKPSELKSTSGRLLQDERSRSPRSDVLLLELEVLLLELQSTSVILRQAERSLAVRRLALLAVGEACREPMVGQPQAPLPWRSGSPPWQCQVAWTLACPWFQ